MKTYILVYDIVDDRARRRASNVLTAWGYRVQKSVFEITLKSDHEAKKLQEELLQAIRPEAGVRLYRLCERCKHNSLALNGEPIVPRPNTVIL